MSPRRPAKPVPQPAYTEKPKPTGQLYTQDCHACGKPRSAWGFKRPDQPRRWYCYEHRDQGDIYLQSKENV